MNKINLFLDADETLLNSIESFVKVYNERYNTNADHTQLKQYNFKDICPLLKENEVKDIFSSERFWELVTIKDGCLNVLNNPKNIEKFNYILVTIGNPKNLYLKSKFIAKNFPMIEQMCLITNKNNEMNKELVQMKNGIFIDDHKSNLISSNALYKVLLKEKEYEWNEITKSDFKENFIIADNWNYIGEVLNELYKF